MSQSLTRLSHILTPDGRVDLAAVERAFNESEQLRHQGVRIEYSKPDEAVVLIDQVQSYHRGGMGTEALHGGIISLIADLALGLLGMAHVHTGLTATRDLGIQFLKPLLASSVRATARVTERVGNKVFGHVSITNEKGETCAVATGYLVVGITRP